MWVPNLMLTQEKEKRKKENWTEYNTLIIDDGLTRRAQSPLSPPSLFTPPPSQKNFELRISSAFNNIISVHVYEGTPTREDYIKIITYIYQLRNNRIGESKKKTKIIKLDADLRPGSLPETRSKSSELIVHLAADRYKSPHLHHNWVIMIIFLILASRVCGHLVSPARVVLGSRARDPHDPGTGPGGLGSVPKVFLPLAEAAAVLASLYFFDDGE